LQTNGLITRIDLKMFNGDGTPAFVEHVCVGLVVRRMDGLDPTDGQHVHERNREYTGDEQTPPAVSMWMLLDATFEPPLPVALYKSFHVVYKCQLVLWSDERQVFHTNQAMFVDDGTIELAHYD
jgi:hypothetical protein